MRIYFDNAASCMPDQEILGYYYSYASSLYANQEAAHKFAYSLREKITAAEKNISTTLCGEDAFVHWGDSGTGLFSLLPGFEFFQSGNIITSPMEHPALTAALQRSGAEIRMVKIKNGQIDIDHFTELLDKNTVLTAFHHVQSETGIIQNLENIGKTIHKYAPQCLFMADTIQSAGKLPIPWKAANLDIISVSGHKIGASEGAALVLNKKNQIFKNFAEYFKLCRKKYYTAGRINPAAVLALSHGITKKTEELDKNRAKITSINLYLRDNLQKLKLINNKKIILTVPPENSSPYILHFIVPGYQSGVLVRMLSNEGIFFSAGSACQAESSEPSPTLLAMNFSREDAYAGIRLSFCNQNSLKEAACFLDKFQKNLLAY